MMLRGVILFSFSAVCFLSCHKSEKVCGGTEQPVPVVIETDIRGGIKTGFTEGDRIGIFPVEYVDGRPGTLGDVRNPLNVEYVYDGRYWSAAPGSEDIILEASATDFYAYYPYDPEVSAAPGKTDLGAYPFDLSGDQSQFETDFLWAKTSAVTSSQNRTLLLFSHVFSRFIVNLDYNDSDPADAMLEIHNTKPHVTIDLATGNVTRLDIRDEIMPALLDEAPEGFDLSYSAIVAPGRIDRGTPVFSMDNGGETSLFYLSSDVEFRAGYTYTFNIILGTASTEPEASPDHTRGTTPRS